MSRKNISDLYARLKLNQSAAYIGRVYDMKPEAVSYLISGLKLCRPDPANISNYPDAKYRYNPMQSIDRNDITEEELIRGYVAPTGKDLVGDELEIYDEK